MFDLDFREFIESLNKNNVRYLVVGGYAMAFHGHPRFTKDLDVWIEITTENAKKLVQAIADFGLGSIGLTEDDFSEPEEIIQLGYPPSRIDILTSIDGVDFDHAYTQRVSTSIEGLTINFITLRDLKINKKATGRDQDLLDLKELGEN